MASNTHGGRRSQIANYILITAAVLLLLAYPFQDFFVGGLLTHLAGAALIGGLADWYAVTALFRRPLGISFKTALIPNSKERIAETARHMIESEILTVPNMYNVLKHHPILGATLDYLHTEKGFQSAERVFGQILNTFLYTIDMKTVVKAFAGIGGQVIEKVDLAPIMSKAIKIGLHGESGKDFLDFMILNLEDLVRSETMKRYVGEIYEASLRQYAKHNIFLGWAIKAALKMEVFQPDHVAGLLQTKWPKPRKTIPSSASRPCAICGNRRKRSNSTTNGASASTAIRTACTTAWSRGRTRKKPGSATSRTRNGRSGSARSQLITSSINWNRGARAQTRWNT